MSMSSLVASCSKRCLSVLCVVQSSKFPANSADTQIGAPSSATRLPAVSDVASLIAARRSVFPKDFSGQTVDRYIKIS